MKKITSFFSLVVLLINIFVPSISYADSHKLKVTFFYVGNADCIFVQLPDGENMLIDAGLDREIENYESYTEHIVDYIASTGCTTIDYVVETHPHEDHIGRMVSIIDSFDIGAYYRPDDYTKTITYSNTLKKLTDNEIDVINLFDGMVIDDSDEFDIVCLSPSFITPFDESLYDSGADGRAIVNSEINNDSVVLKLKYKNNSFLFTGDIEARVEKELVEKYKSELDCDVLKLAHHGSITSSTQEFLNAVSPEHTIISCGVDNKYNHPTNTALRRLINVKSHIYRTDVSGDITVTSDGKNISVDKDETNLPVATPEMISVTRKNTSMNVKWGKVSGASGYLLYRSIGGSYEKIAVLDKDTLSYTDTSIIKGNKYFYKVKAYNDYSTSSFSNFKYDFIKLPATTIKVSSNSVSSLKLSWVKIDNAKGYYIYRATSKNGSYKKIATLTNPYKTSYIDTNLTAGKKYFYKMVAYSTYSGSNSPNSNIVSLAPIPDKVTNLKLSLTKSKTLKVRWTKLKGVSGYDVYTSTSKNGKFKKLTSANKNNYTDKSVKKGKTYYYKVRAYKTVSGKKIYGPYSKVISKKIKK